ncbi:sugar phosphate isomerase/epimerase [Eubacteriales bacterium mix99]|jgi:sugar phosphate isomerase/epimerase
MSLKTCLYSITYLGIWYKGEALTWQDVLARAKKFGYDGVEFDCKRPHANPMDWTEDVRKAVVDQAGTLGLALPVLSADNDFSSPVPEHREAQLLMVKEQLRLAADLGCKVLRVFAAWPGITMRDGMATYDEARGNWERCFRDVPFLQRWRFVRDTLKEACRYAGEYGVTMALQNHPPIVGTWREVYDMVTEVDSPWLKACFDLNHECDDPAIIREAFDTIGSMDVHYHYNGEWERKDGVLMPKRCLHHNPLMNYGTFVKEMKRVGYDGYLSYEFCHPAMDGSDFAGIDYVDGQTQMALEYTKGLMANS